MSDNFLRSNNLFQNLLRKRAFHVLEENGYEILEVLGSGSFGEVVACRTLDWTQVAIKIVSSELSSRGELVIWKRFRHPNILPLLDFMRFPGFDIFIMPLHPKTLCDYLYHSDYRSTRTGFQSSKDWLRDVLLGLEYLHNISFCYLDLKSDNVLITSQMNAVICDFTFVNITEDCVGWYGLPYHFRPPETSVGTCQNIMIRGIPFDIWSVGILALELWCVDWFGDVFDQLGRHWMEDVYPILSEALRMPAFDKMLKSTFPCAPIRSAEVTQALNLLQATMRYRPEDRPSVSAILQHPIISVDGETTLLEPDQMWVHPNEQEQSITEELSVNVIPGPNSSEITDEIPLTEDSENGPSVNEPLSTNNSETSSSSDGRAGPISENVVDGVITKAVQNLMEELFTEVIRRVKIREIREFVSGWENRTIDDEGHVDNTLDVDSENSPEAMNRIFNNDYSEEVEEGTRTTETLNEIDVQNDEVFGTPSENQDKVIEEVFTDEIAMFNRSKDVSEMGPVRRKSTRSLVDFQINHEDNVEVETRHSDSALREKHFTKSSPQIENRKEDSFDISETIELKDNPDCVRETINDAVAGTHYDVSNDTSENISQDVEESVAEIPPVTASQTLDENNFERVDTTDEDVAQEYTEDSIGEVRSSPRPCPAETPGEVGETSPASSVRPSPTAESQAVPDNCVTTTSEKAKRPERPETTENTSSVRRRIREWFVKKWNRLRLCKCCCTRTDDDD